MPGTIRVSVLEVVDLPEGKAGITYAVQASLGNRKNVTDGKPAFHVSSGALSLRPFYQDFQFSVLNLLDPLVISLMDAQSHTALGRAEIKVPAIVEKGMKDEYYSLSCGGRIHLKLSFFLTEAERAKIAAIRAGGKKRPSGSQVAPEPPKDPVTLSSESKGSAGQELSVASSSARPPIPQKGPVSSGKSPPSVRPPLVPRHDSTSPQSKEEPLRSVKPVKARADLATSNSPGEKSQQLAVTSPLILNYEMSGPSPELQSQAGRNLSDKDAKKPTAASSPISATKEPIALEPSLFPVDKDGPSEPPVGQPLAPSASAVSPPSSPFPRAVPSLAAVASPPKSMDDELPMPEKLSLVPAAPATSQQSDQISSAVVLNKPKSVAESGAPQLAPVGKDSKTSKTSPLSPGPEAHQLESRKGSQSVSPTSEMPGSPPSYSSILKSVLAPTPKSSITPQPVLTPYPVSPLATEKEPLELEEGSPASWQEYMNGRQAIATAPKGPAAPPLPAVPEVVDKHVVALPPVESAGDWNAYLNKGKCDLSVDTSVSSPPRVSFDSWNPAREGAPESHRLAGAASVKTSMQGVDWAPGRESPKELPAPVDHSQHKVEWKNAEISTPAAASFPLEGAPVVARPVKPKTKASVPASNAAERPEGLSKLMKQVLGGAAVLVSVFLLWPRDEGRQLNAGRPRRTRFHVATRGETLEGLVPPEACDVGSRFRLLNPQVCDQETLYEGQKVYLP